MPVSTIAMRRESISIDGVPMSVVRMGAGNPVVCLSAVGHDAFDFVPLAERLGGRHEFICIEWPSHGDSGPDREPASAARYVELIEGVLWQLSVQRPIIVGNSIGGAVGILYAARHDVSALVLCDSGGLVEVDATVAKICRAFSRFYAAGARGAFWFKPMFALLYRTILPASAARTQRNRIVASADRITPALAQAWRSFGEQSADLRDVASELSTPIWVAWSQSDRLIPLSRCRPAIERLKNASLDTFAGGHSAFLEQPDEFAEKFAEFVATTASDSPGRRLRAA